MGKLNTNTILMLSNVLVAVSIICTVIAMIYGTVMVITIISLLTIVFSVENIIIRRIISSGWARIE